ncbi:MAG: IspD/TarI family cytidylyltransferase [Candidatus Limivicinus sp.]|jgi:2-C-methyl-D-erythritol 4-phosphate cytidylyltransferase
MNIALIFAGGAGARMNSRTLPKQFLELHRKPIIIHTIEYFENHDEIDGIVVACIDGWHTYLQKKLEQFGITKVNAIVPGGATGQLSICNGVNKIHELYPEDSVVLVHDGVRPLINMQVISDNIASVRKYGSAITVSPAIETITVLDEDHKQIRKIMDRSKCFHAKAPQSFYLKDLYKTHQAAFAAGKFDYIDSASLMQAYGYHLTAVEGPVENIKITTPSDFYIFRAIMDARENSQIFGI